jgi:protein gp37
MEYEALLVPVDKAEYDDNITFELDNTTDGPRARKMVDQWIQNCTGHHDRCRLDDTRAFLPTRLLEINDSSEQPTYCLVLRTECPPSS